MTSIDALEPNILWLYFDDLTRIPRPSKKEEKIIAYLQSFANIHQLECVVDRAGNILIRKPATLGMENRQKVILQAHLDMVCEKNADIVHNFETDAISTYIDGDWVKARGTTLGADNGIGVAVQLAVLASKDISHGAIECLFTVDEETGLTGAFALEKDFLQGTVLLNLDSEEEGEFCIGCAGGIDTVASFEYVVEKAPESYFFFSVEVQGLKGGHSGEDINKGRANANKLLAEYLQRLTKNSDVRIAFIEGGNLRNAIPREARAIVAVPMSEKEQVRVEINHYIAEIEERYVGVETSFRANLESTDSRDLVITKKVADALIFALNQCPHGVIAMSKDVVGLVETSSNLASVKMLTDKIVVATSQRSAVDESKKQTAKQVADIFSSVGAVVSHSDGYPGWKPRLNSPITQIAVSAYERLFGVAPKLKAIHAGLECGLFLEKYPHLDMVSFGPTIIGAHSPDERVSISSTRRFWLLLRQI
jgi:dipeptidase D